MRLKSDSRVTDLLLHLVLLFAPRGPAHAAATARPAQAVFLPETLDGGTKGGVASEATECSAIGRDIIAAGGNAVDATIGTTFCVGVIGMYHSGIGGGGFALVRDANGSIEAVDFRETAPAAAHRDMYRRDDSLSKVGGLAVGVPGEVLGLEYLHDKYGSLPWSDVMQGAIRLARRGFRVSSDLNAKMNTTFTNGSSFLLDDAVFAAEFAPNGHLLKQGDIMTRPRLARTLEKIASHGSRIFYHGEIASTLVRSVRSHNGILTLDDLASYSVVTRPVHTIRFRGLDVHGIAAPASGAVALQMLEVLARYPAPRDSDSDPDRNLTIHRLAEVQRFGYAYRARLGDPAFAGHDDEGHDDVHRYEENLLAPDTIGRIRAAIRDDRTAPPKSYFPPDSGARAVAAPESHGTSHVSVADASGMAVSLTTTINLKFGARIMDPVSGIILNDEMNDFSIPGTRNEFGFPPSPANFIRPHKRPLSSMTPLLVTRPPHSPHDNDSDSVLVAALGAAGGSRITSATVQCLWRAVGDGGNKTDVAVAMAEAVRRGRVHDQLVPNVLRLEDYRFPGLGATAADLRARGHVVEIVGPGLSAVQAVVRRDDGSFEAVSEPRQANSAGYSV